MSLREAAPKRAARPRLVAALLFVLVALPVHFWPMMHTANESIRLYFVQAVVDRHELNVDGVMARYQFANIDAAVRDGRHFLDKAPGLSLLAMPPYFALTRLGMSTEPNALPQLHWLLTLFTVAGSAVAGAHALASLARALGADAARANAAAIALCACTPYGLYATLFFSHSVAAACLCGALALAVRARGDAGADWRFASAGALAGLMVLVETTTAPLGAGLFLYVAAATRSPRRVLFFVLGSAPWIAAQLAYNAVVFGGPLRFAYGFKATAEFAAMHAHGLYGFRMPSLSRLSVLLVEPARGLFFGWPMLAFGVAGFVAARKDPKYRLEWTSLALLTSGYVVVISMFEDVRAGASFGPRHLVPVVPLLVLGTVFAPVRLRGLAAGAAAVGFLSTWGPALTFPYALESFDNPLFELTLPLLARGFFSPSILSLFHLPRWTVLVPLSVVSLALVWITWRSVSRTTRTRAVAAGAIVVLAWVVIGVFAANPPTAAQDGERARALVLFGRRGVEQARMLCASGAACDGSLRRYLGP